MADPQSEIRREEKNDAPETLEKSVTIDTLHNDEAVKVLATYAGDQEWTPEEEKKLVRRIDKRLTSILCATYGLQYYDKAMLSQAALFGLREDLQLSVGIRYSMSSAIFYLGFIVGAYPAILLAQRYPIERVIFGIVFLWGACLTCTAACHNWQSLYAQRFFLGFLESGVSPGFMLIVGGWFTKQEQALRMGAWYSMTGYVSIFSPLINYGLGHITGSLSPWRYMYLVAGSITILWSFVILFFMPPDPIRARGFSDREKYIAVARMRQNNSGVRNTHFKIGQVYELLLDRRFWMVFIMAFTMLVANGPVSTFIPLIIRDLGFSGLNSLLLVMPAGFVIGTIELVAPYVCYRWKGWRAYVVTICVCGTIIGSFILWKLPQSQKGARLFGVYILASYGGAYAVLMSMQIANTAGYTKRSVGSSGMFVGYCLGNFVGPLVFKATEAPRYNTGWIVTIATSIVCAVVSLIYRLDCVMENKRRDKAGQMEAFDHAYEDDLTDKKNPQFRYTL
ncbi:putative transporter [Cyphellophora attinorum]|uniref:Putative transporter n=1 Tax=Cyphellophora attinorum TaxID=1664694 RepID=A0A0N1H5G7_9EURO|nr:putative transporter [Phialophora attinorum]KPI40942.1 putative transporter [Phialophora attinorum]